MKTLKNYLAFVALISLLFTSCSKEETGGLIDDPANTEVAELSFGTLLSDMNRAMKAHGDLPRCSDNTPATVDVVISQTGEDNIVLTLNILYDSDTDTYFTEYTEELKFPIASGGSINLMLQQFIVRDEFGAELWVAPIGTGLANFVDTVLPMPIVLGAGVKKYVEVDVLCYDERFVNEYGYLFFDINEGKVVDFCVFANYCADNGRHYVADYNLEIFYMVPGEGNDIDLTPEVNSPNTGTRTDDFFADPVCVVIPSPRFGEGDDEPYLFYRLTLNDWDANYGDIDENLASSEITGTLSWNDIETLVEIDGDNDSSTTDYLHLFFNCGDDDGSTGNGGTDGGNGNGGNGNGGNGNGGNGGDDCEWTIVDPSGQNCYRATLLNEGDSFTEVVIYSGIPLLDTDGLAAGNFGVSSVDGGIEYSFDIGGNTVPEYVIQITDAEGGTIYCSDQTDDNNIVEGSFTLPVYIRVAANICEPNE